MRRMTRRQVAARGFTLTETLVALLLVGILGTIIVAGIPAARTVYNDMLRKENAESVCTTITNRASAELRDATEFQVLDDGTAVFVSHSGSALDGLRLGLTTSASGHEGQVLVVFYERDASGVAAITTGDYAPELLLPESTYVLELQASVSIARKSANLATLTVQVYYDDPTKPLAEQTVDVAVASEVTSS